MDYWKSKKRKISLFFLMGIIFFIVVKYDDFRMSKNKSYGYEQKASVKIIEGKTAVKLGTIGEFSMSDFKMSNQEDTLYFKLKISKTEYSGFYVSSEDTVILNASQ